MVIFMIIFDLDGTLWNTLNATYEGVNEIFLKNNLEPLSKEHIAKGMGLNFSDIAKHYMPKLDKEIREQIMNQIIVKTREIILEKGANFYDGVNDIIINLSKKYKLGIVTNNNDEYVKTFLKVSNLEEYFNSYIGAASYNIEKNEAIKKLLDENNVTKGIYVGDTEKDMIESEKAGAIFIYAKYGFDKNLNSKYAINDIKELPDLINKIYNS